MTEIEQTGPGEPETAPKLNNLDILHERLEISEAVALDLIRGLDAFLESGKTDVSFDRQDVEALLAVLRSHTKVVSWVRAATEKYKES